MRLSPFRRTPAASPPPRPNPARIAALEHVLFGTEPGPGMGAVALAIRRSGICLTHRPVDVSTIGEEPGTRAICAGCSRPMHLDDSGTWKVTDDNGSDT